MEELIEVMSKLTTMQWLVIVVCSLLNLITTYGAYDFFYKNYFKDPDDKFNLSNNKYIAILGQYPFLVLAIVVGLNLIFLNILIPIIMEKLGILLVVFRVIHVPLGFIFILVFIIKHLNIKEKDRKWSYYLNPILLGEWFLIFSFTVFYVIIHPYLGYTTFIRDVVNEHYSIAERHIVTYKHVHINKILYYWLAFAFDKVFDFEYHNEITAYTEAPRSSLNLMAKALNVKPIHLTEV